MVETATNIVVGYLINFFLNLAVLPMFGFNVTVSQNLIIGLIFTVVSVIRSYGMRRVFNWVWIRWG